MVEAQGIEPWSWADFAAVATCLGPACVLIHPYGAGRAQDGSSVLFFLAGGARLPGAPGQPDAFAWPVIRHPRRDVTDYAASAYSVFAVTFLTDD